MSNRSSIDWLELDRLVDGRLDGDAYRELLCQIDADPDGWRQCAMAFLEHQALTKELSAFAAEPEAERMAFPPEPLTEAPVESKVNLSEKRSKSSSASVIGWVTMALCIVGGTALGFTLNSDFQDSLKPALNPGVPMNNVDELFANQLPGDAMPSDTELAPKKRRCNSQRYSLQTRANKSCPMKECQDDYERSLTRGR